MGDWNCPVEQMALTTGSSATQLRGPLVPVYPNVEIGTVPFSALRLRNVLWEHDAKAWVAEAARMRACKMDPMLLKKRRGVESDKSLRRKGNQTRKTGFCVMYSSKKG
jgi:hypothetical protein